VTYDLFTFRQAMPRDLLILAQIVGSNSTAALTFDDPKAGRATLASLSAQRRIVAACLYGKDGKVFATYRRDHEGLGLAARTDECPVAERGHLQVSRPIMFDGDPVGAIAIESDLQEFYARLVRYASIGVVVIVASSFVGWLLSLQLQQVISTPILHLVETTRAVSEKMDYSVRAVKHNEDEVGLLIEGFNEMLTQIEKRDGRLVPFDFDRIAAAIWKAMAAAEEGGEDDSKLVAHQVSGELARFAKHDVTPPAGDVNAFELPNHGATLLPGMQDVE